MILTLPHMLGASNEYRKMIRGLKPDAKKHQTFVDVQSVSNTISAYPEGDILILNIIDLPLADGHAIARRQEGSV